MQKRYGPLKYTPCAAGVDEAGRGCLAGPVFVAAIILPEKFELQGLTDSKRLTPEKREDFASVLKEKGIWSLAIKDAREIELHNILQATLLAMQAAVLKLDVKPTEVYIDGTHYPEKLKNDYRIYAYPKADLNYASVAAASIIAKTERDRFMKKIAIEYPEYGFDQHFGYGTRKHLEAIQKNGPCILHRMNFSPLKEMNTLCLPYDK